MPAFCDFETRSTADLRAVGLHNYAAHPSTDAWCFSYAIDRGPTTTWRPGMANPDWLDSDCEVVAHNAPFELAIWNGPMRRRYGWPELRIERVTCTSVRAYAMGLPGSLAGAGAALGLKVQKDGAGHALMLRMCRPRRLDGDTPVWWDDEERIARLIAYCETDVDVERQLYYKLLSIGEPEIRLWRLDQRINARGIRIDRASVQAAVTAVRAAKRDLDKEMAEVTGGAVSSCSALGALKDWLPTRGVSADGLAKGDIVDLLGTEMPPEARRALVLRQEAGKASTAKLSKMLDLAGADDRIRNGFQFHGAATGRWAGRGLQLHNFPRDVPPAATVEKFLALLRAGQWRAVDAIHGSVMGVVSRCLRGLLVPDPGNVLVGGDFANVEGRGVAWFSGETWKVRAFMDADAGTGPDLYKLAYAKTFGVPVDSVDPMQRQFGKVEELALPYGGGVGAFRSMAATFGIVVPDDKANEIKIGWRAGHPATVRTWRALESAAIRATQDEGTAYPAGHPERPVLFKRAGSFLWCLLPCRTRALCYPYPKIMDGKYGPQLTYFTVPSTNDIKRGTLVADPLNTNTWARVATYGGSLMENVIQATCRDLLAYCMEQLEAAGLPIVLHVHDEIVCEVPEERAEDARAIMERIMNTVPAWAAGFPLTAKCHAMHRYGK